MFRARLGNGPPGATTVFAPLPPYFPVAAVAELQRLAANTKAILGQVTAPALIIQTKDDQTVRPRECEDHSSAPFIPE